MKSNRVETFPSPVASLQAALLAHESLFQSKASRQGCHLRFLTPQTPFAVSGLPACFS
jgi:hypothetical protein